MIGTFGYAGTRCRVKQGWEDAGREGEALCYFEHEKLGQQWILVIWDDEDDPDCFKAAGLEIKTVVDDDFRDGDRPTSRRR
jgi:hypothetical protein